ncbi:hypothetical protein PVK06_015279 [Gossypium arboreum]|uniref:Uncharacterized protein n=1 Tax=Gossypium arboreum TaxID=29729 RepID=A0ABR0PX27_GOSAR|nr:hypothetical protein PVK06_015279 [Gossypium arboreum]
MELHGQVRCKEWQQIRREKPSLGWGVIRDQNGACVRGLHVTLVFVRSLKSNCGGRMMG